MKKLFVSLSFLFAVVTAFAQPAEVIQEGNGTKILKGFVTKKDLATDTAFTWFAQNAKGYVPEATALKALRENKDSIYIIGFGGTWCGDTKNILPKFFTLLDAAGYPQDRVTFLGVDHNKKTVQHLSETFNITNVPTFIVMRNGKEVGRVVEYGKYGMFDKELGDIITASAKK